MTNLQAFRLAMYIDEWNFINCNRPMMRNAVHYYRTVLEAQRRRRLEIGLDRLWDRTPGLGVTLRNY